MASKTKGRVLTPREVELVAGDMRASLEKLTDKRYGYREAHTYVRGDRRDSPTDENKGMRISGSSVSDPTSAIAESQRVNRDRLSEAGASLTAAALAIDTAIASIRSVFSGSDDYYQPLESYRP